MWERFGATTWPGYARRPAAWVRQPDHADDKRSMTAENLEDAHSASNPFSTALCSTALASSLGPAAAPVTATGRHRSKTELESGTELT